MINWILSPGVIVAGIAIATLLLLGVIAILYLGFRRDDRRYEAQHTSGGHTWPATFQAAPESRKTALTLAIDLSGRGRGNSRSATPSAVVPAPAGQPPASPQGPVPYYAAVAWQAAGVNGRARNWTPRLEATTSWDTPLARELQDLLQAESVDLWLDQHFGPAMTSARKAIGA